LNRAFGTIFFENYMRFASGGSKMVPQEAQRKNHFASNHFAKTIRARSW